METRGVDHEPELIVSGARLGYLLEAATHAPLRAGQVFSFYLWALAIYVLPLILNNILFVDDIEREMEVANWWKLEGRVLADYLFNALGFTPGTPDFFPLSMLLAILIMAVALTHLAFAWFGRPVLSQCLILLPLWYNPFYLQELSYQYECLTLSLGVALVILAVSFTARSGVLTLAMRGLMVAAMLSLDQLPLNVYVGLACIDVLRQSTLPANASQLFKRPRQHGSVLLIGMLVYYLTAYQMLINDRGGLVWPTLNQWGERIGTLASCVALFVTPANRLLFIVLLICALAGLGLTVRRALQSPVGGAVKAVYVCLTLAATIGVVLAVGGVLLFLYDLSTNSGARTLVGVSTLLVALFLMAYRCIDRLGRRWTLLLALPLFMFLSFAYVYGQYLRQQEELQVFIRTQVMSDIFNHDAVGRARSISVLDDNNDINNAFARVCLHKMLPAIDYIAANGYLLMSEQLAKWGITDRVDSPVPLPALGEPVVRRPFYEIHVVDDHAYIRFLARVARPACPSLE